MEKIDLGGGKTFNSWDSEVELFARRAEGVALARKHFPGDEFSVWGRRCINLAQHISTDRWEYCKTLKKDELVRVVEHMIRLGFPADNPVDERLKQPAH
jgi:hypothetical protein